VSGTLLLLRPVLPLSPRCSPSASIMLLSHSNWKLSHLTAD